MASKGYQLGYDFEVRVKKYLEADGWYVVRSSGSHSPIDLLAVKLNEQPIGIQCRRTERLSKAEDAELKKLGATYGFRPLLVYRLPDKSIEFRNLL